MENVTEHKQITENQKLTFASTTAGFALEDMDGAFLSFALSSMIVSLHITPGAAGLTSTITNFGKIFGGLLFGMLADRFGRVKVFSYTILLFALATGAMFFAHNIYEIYFLRFLAGFGSGGEFGAGMSLLSENFRHHKLGKIVSASTIGGEFGGILAAIVASIMLTYFNWNALFLVGLIPVALAFFIRRHLKESSVFEEEMKKDHNRPKVSLSELFKTPHLAWQTISIMLMAVVETSGYYGLLNWLPTIMQKQMHISISKSSLWMVVTILGISAGMYTFGMIMDKLGPRLAFGLYMFIAAFSVFGISLAHNAIMLLIACALAGFFATGFYGGFGVIISRLYPTNIRTTANNMIMSFAKAIGGFTPLVMGILMSSYSLTTIMLLVSSLYIIGIFIMLTVKGLKDFDDSEFLEEKQK